MEAWKIERFISTASTDQLRETAAALATGIANGSLSGRQAKAALAAVEEDLALRALLEPRDGPLQD